MVKVTVWVLVVVLVKLPLIFPDPFAAIPVTFTVLSLVQLYTVPGTVPDNTIVEIADPEHIACDAGVATASGVGLTVIVNVFDGPVQVGVAAPGQDASVATSAPVNARLKKQNSS